MKYKIILLIFLLPVLTSEEAFPQSSEQAASASSPVEVKALFEYPVAPDTLTNFTEMSDWLVANFWDKFEPSGSSVSQIALNHAFKAWSAPLRYSHKDVAIKAVDALIKRIEKNPTLLYQFTKAADDCLYGDKAEVWIDEPMLLFSNALVKNKKLDATRKARYKAIADQLKNSIVGSKFPQLQLVDVHGKKFKLSPNKKGITVVMIGEPDCSDCRMAKLKFDMNEELEAGIASGKVAFNFVIPDAEDAEDWQTKVSSYPTRWIIGAATAAEDVIDLRNRPAIYLLGSDGEIVMKTNDAEQALEFIISQISEK